MDDFIRKPYRTEEIFDCLKHQLHVSFIHEKAPAASVSEKTTIVLRPEALATLPQELRREFTGALVSLDADRISGIIGRVSELNQPLGDILGQYADKFDYTSILNALETAGGHSGKEST